LDSVRGNDDIRRIGQAGCELQLREQGALADFGNAPQSVFSLSESRVGRQKRGPDEGS
jgi:hypothetical protein